jgi:Tfp pilus assembly protein PilN
VSPDFSTRAAGHRGIARYEPLLLAIAAVLFLVSAASASRSWAEARSSQLYLDGLRGELQQERDRLRALESTRRAGASLMTSKLALTVEAPPARVLAQLSALLPPDVRLDSVTFSYGERLDIEAVAVARRPASYDVLLERLSASPLFGEIQPGPEARQGEMRGFLRFVYKGVP